LTSAGNGVKGSFKIMGSDEQFCGARIKIIYQSTLLLFDFCCVALFYTLYFYSA
jgi:hypothetical protein